MINDVNLNLNKNDRLFRQLQSSILSGEFPAGAKIPTERELAENYNCSRVTVRGSLRKLEELRMIERVRGSGTYVSPGSGKPQIICRRIAIFLEGGFVNFDDNPYISQILSGLFQCGRQLEFMPEIIAVKPNPKLPWREFSVADCAGFIIGFQLSQMQLDDLRKFGVPFVAMQEPEGDSDTSYVTIDNFNGAYVATQHLIESGRRNILFLNGPLTYKMNRDKFNGFSRVLEETGIEQEPRQRMREIVPSDDVETSAIVRKLLDDNIEFDSLLIHGDWATWATVNLLREHGIRIPEDVSIVMYDQFSWVSRALKLPLSAVRQPFAEQIKAALRVLAKKLERPELSQIVQTIQPTLAVRKSSMIF